MSQAGSQEFKKGVDQFNQGQFYACHDTLEALWMEAREPEKTFYQGILQIAVALYHLSNSNWQGAVILLGEGISRLRRYPATYAGIDTDELLTSSATLLAALQQSGPERIGDWVVSPNAIATADETLRLPHIFQAAN